MSSNYDVVIVQDVTASQWPYLNATRYQIHNIISTLRKKIKRYGEIRFRLVVFRDHPPMDPGPFVIWRYGFTSSADTFMKNVAEHVPKGNVDGPEAQMDGLREALYSKWAPNSSRTVILITDSAPHAMRSGTEEGFPDRCPCGTDPKWLMNQYIKHAVTLHVIGCEPTLSGKYQHGREYYTAFATLTNGIFLPMNRFLEGKSMKKIRDAIVGMVLYTADNHRLALKLGGKIHEQAAHGESKIARELHRELVKEGVQHYSVASANIYPRDPQVGNNIWAWKNRKSTGEVWKITYNTSLYQRIYQSAWTNEARGLNITFKRNTITHTQVLQVVRIALAQKKKNAEKKVPAKKSKPASKDKTAKKGKPAKKATPKTKRIVTSHIMQVGAPTEGEPDDEEGDTEESGLEGSENDSDSDEDELMLRALLGDEANDGEYEHKEEGAEDPEDPDALGGVDSDDPSEDEEYDDTDVEDFEDELFPRIRLEIPEESEEQTGETEPSNARRGGGDSEKGAKDEGGPPKGKPEEKMSSTVAQALRLMGGRA